MLKENCHSKCNILMRKIDDRLVMSIWISIGDTPAKNYINVKYCPECGLDINGNPAQPLKGDKE